MCLIPKKKGKSKVLSRGFCLFDSEAEQRVQCLCIYCANVNSYSSPPESTRQNSPDRAMDLPFFFRCKHITSLKNRDPMGMCEEFRCM